MMRGRHDRVNGADQGALAPAVRALRDAGLDADQEWSPIVPWGDRQSGSGPGHRTCSPVHPDRSCPDQPHRLRNVMKPWFVTARGSFR